jgi:hypothetical protein
LPMIQFVAYPADGTEQSVMPPVVLLVHIVCPVPKEDQARLLMDLDRCSPEQLVESCFPRGLLPFVHVWHLDR